MERLRNFWFDRVYKKVSLVSSVVFLVIAALTAVGITKHIAGFAETAQNTARSANNTQAAAAQLTETAAELQAFVSRFRMGERPREDARLQGLLERTKGHSPRRTRARDQNGDGPPA